MNTYGLTGGIASGKSTVAGMFEDLGARLIDADAIARDIAAPGTPLAKKILEEFGDACRLPDGGLDRRKLRRIVFADAEKRNRLNALVHPAVMEESFHRIQSAREEGASVLIYEAALLVETGLYSGFQGLIVTDCSQETQIARLTRRDGVSLEEAKAALASQTGAETRRKAATFLIDTGVSLSELRRQVEQLWPKLRAGG